MNLPSTSRKPRAAGRGFTLVELLVVVTILALLVALLLPALDRARKMAMRAECASNLRQVSHTLLTYASDNFGFYPAQYDVLTTGWVGFSYRKRYNHTAPDKYPSQREADDDIRGELLRYSGSSSIFYCPSDRARFEAPSDPRSFAHPTDAYYIGYSLIAGTHWWPVNWGPSINIWKIDAIGSEKQPIPYRTSDASADDVIAADYAANWYQRQEDPDKRRPHQGWCNHTATPTGESPANLPAHYVKYPAGHRVHADGSVSWHTLGSGYGAQMIRSSIPDHMTWFW